MMQKQTLGMMISTLRKEKEMTQADLAAMMSVTDKAVSKWERDMSCPDVNSLPRLADALGVTVDDLMRARVAPESNDKEKVLSLVLKAIPLAMGVAVIVTGILGEIEVANALVMLGVGLFCLALNGFMGK